MKALRFLAVLLLVVSIPIHVLALDISFDGNDDWFQSKPDKEIILLELDSPNGKLEGTCTYYVDSENKCFYLHLSYNESSIDDGDNTANLHFEISNDNNSYKFIVYENSDESIDKDFKLFKNFGEFQKGGQKIYIGIDFSKSEYKKTNNTLDITLSVNEKATYYNILKNIPLDFGSDKYSVTSAVTATKPTTTKQTAAKEDTTKPTSKEETSTVSTATTEKATKETTTKFKYTVGVTTPTSNGNEETVTFPDTNETTQSSTAPSTTKFTYTTASNDSPSENDGNNGSDNNYEESLDGGTTQAQTTQQDNAGIIIPESESGSTLSPRAKLLIAIAVILAVSGIAMIFHASYKRDNEEDEESESSEEDEDTQS